MKNKSSLSLKIIVLIVATLLLIVLISSYNALFENNGIKVPTTAIQQDPVDAPTPLPEELLANREQTRGVVIGGVILVLIIVIGTFSFIRHKP